MFAELFATADSADPAQPPQPPPVDDAGGVPPTWPTVSGDTILARVGICCLLLVHVSLLFIVSTCQCFSCRNNNL